MSEAIWRQLAAKALGGAGLETLANMTPEGVRIEALSPRSRSPGPRSLRRETGAWGVSQRLDHPRPSEANRLALLDLEGGATGLTIVFAGETAPGFGLPFGADALETALAGIELDFINLRLDAGTRTPDAVRLLAKLTADRRLTSAAVAADLGLDPAGSFARTGRPAGERLEGAALREFIARARDAGLAGAIFLADGRPYHDAGAGPAQELACVLSAGVTYLRRLDQAGFAPAVARRDIAFLLTADAEVFTTLAKFRALRRLWGRVEEVCGLRPEPLRLHAETSWRMMTRFDPWVNVMRTTAAVFAAGTGGADTVTALPFTAAIGLPDDGARRLARNMQRMLLDESHLAKAEDPAAGAGGFEALTEQLTLRAWAMFQDIESEGGIEASLQDGKIQARIASAAAQRARAFASIEQAITGTSAYPALHETKPALAPDAMLPEPEPGPLGLRALRDAEPFEALRDRAAALEAAGTAPAIYLATLGPPASYGASTTYAANLFAAAGITALSGPAADYNGGRTPLVCLCGWDKEAGNSLDGELIGRLRANGAKWIVCVGRPLELGEAPVDGFIGEGCAALEILSGALDRFAL